MSRMGTILLCVLSGVALCAKAQQPAVTQPANTVPEIQARIEQLIHAMDSAQSRINAEQKSLTEIRRQLQELQVALPKASGSAVPLVSADIGHSVTGATPEEQQAMLASQVATLDQEKVESASRYPVRIHGSILVNGFVNSGRVDQAEAPSAALGGNGSTGISLRQTSLGLEATGPRLLGATSHADVNVDFFGTAAQAGYDNAGGLLRMRTAHASLTWKSTELWFAYDRPLLSPYTPESLVASAVPELSWSGNLWSWTPQIGLTQTWGTRTRVRVQAALIDAADSVYVAETSGGASLAQSSRKPGAEMRVALLGNDDARSPSIGVAGYYSPHRFSASPFAPGKDFAAWAGTLDFRLPLGRGLSLTGSAYRGAALGGLGGGGYRDYVFRGTGAAMELRALDDAGGWVQLHHAINQRWAWNGGVGIDNPFVRQIRAFPGTGFSNSYNNVARNRAVDRKSVV